MLGYPEFWAIIAVLLIGFGNAGYIVFSHLTAR